MIIVNAAYAGSKWLVFVEGIADRGRKKNKKKIESMGNIDRTTQSHHLPAGLNG